MSESTTLRRLPGDSPWLLKRLTVLERWIGDGEIEPWLAVLLAEWMRRQSTIDGIDRTPDPPPSSMDEMFGLLHEPDLLAVMKAQADGPWEVYVTQTQGHADTLHLASGLIALGEANMARDDKQQVEESTPARPRNTSRHLYDVAISCAGGDRPFVQPVVRSMQVGARLSVFYDDNESSRAHMAGRDLDSETARLYQREAAHCVAFLSAAYAASEWTMAELRAALARAATEAGYLKPVRLDDTGFPELPNGLVYFDARPGRLLADPALLSELLVKSLRGPDAVAPGHGPEAILGLSDSDEAAEEVRRHFDTVLPAMLRLHKDTATAIGGSVHFSIKGRIKEDWLLCLGPPEDSVSRLHLDQDPNVPVLPRHLRVRLSVRAMIKMLRGDFDPRQSLIDGTTELAGDLTLLKEVGKFLQQQWPSR